jgi:hypothetical protein
MTAAGTSRAIVTNVCRTLGILVLATGVLLSYATRVVFDADTFAFRASRSLQEPRVAEYLAGQLSDAVIAQNRDLMAYRPILVTTARAVVASESFAAVFRRAARTAHAVLFSESAEKVFLSLPDVSVLLRAAARSEPDFVERLPSELTLDLTDEIDRILGQNAVLALQLGERFKKMSARLLWAGFLLLVIGFAVATDRRTALLHTGIGIAIAAGLLLLVPPIIGRLLALRVEDSAMRSLVAGVWHSLAEGVRIRALILAGISIVLAAAATAMASRLDTIALLRNAWRILNQPLRNPGLNLLRIAALVSVGLLLVLHPLTTLRVILMIVGAFLAFEGFYSFFALIAPHAERSAAAVRELGTDAAPGHRWRWALVATLTLALVGAAALFLHSPAAVQAPRFTGECNGSAALCGRSFDEIVLPGAHNAMAAADIGGWMFPSHERGIESQLRDGIRALLIDAHYGTPLGGAVRTDLEDEAAARRKYEAVIGAEGVDAAMRIRDRLVGEPEGPRAPYLCHAFCELGAQPLTPVLGQVRDFLVQHPGEVLLIVVEDNVAPADIATAFEESGLLELVYQGAAQPPWPTLGEMLATDQRVVVLAENDASGVPWYHLSTQVMQETPYAFHAPDEFSCEPNRGGTKGSLFLVNHWIESAPAPKPSNAAIVNERGFLLRRVQHCEATRGKKATVIAVDFYRTGDVVEVAAMLNRIRIEARP